MAEKKGKPQSRKGKKKRASSFMSLVKEMLLSAFTVVVYFTGALFIYNWFYSISKVRSAEKKQDRAETIVRLNVSDKGGPGTSGEEAAQATKNRQTMNPKKETSAHTFQEGTEISGLKNRQKEQVTKHEGYTASYNSDCKIINWVTYELTSKEATSKKNEQSNKLVLDPIMKGASVTDRDYARPGYGRGHMAPADDMKWSVKVMRESSYLNNICPQEPGLNRGIWKDLEEQARLWAKENGSLLIVTDPVITGDLKRLGKNRVGVPKTFYRVICTVMSSKSEGVGFLSDSKDYGKTPLKSMTIPTDNVEKVTEIDLFPSSSDSIENPMKAHASDGSWSS